MKEAEPGKRTQSVGLAVPSLPHCSAEGLSRGTKGSACLSLSPETQKKEPSPVCEHGTAQPLTPETTQLGVPGSD